MANETPFFMQEAIKAWRKDTKLLCPIMRAAERIDPALKGDFDGAVALICGRRKTPEVKYGRVRHWLARYFRPVSDALMDGATEKEALLLWINTEPRKLNYSKFPGSRRDADMRGAMRGKWELRPHTYDTRRDWNTVK